MRTVFSWCNSNSGLADYICGAVKRFGKKGGKVMLRDSQLWMQIGRICTLLANLYIVDDVVMELQSADGIY